jgi:hypothetical protein
LAPSNIQTSNLMLGDNMDVLGKKRSYSQCISTPRRSADAGEVGGEESEMLQEFRTFICDFESDLQDIKGEITSEIDIYERELKFKLKEENFKTILAAHKGKLSEMESQMTSYEKILYNIEEVRKYSNLELLQKLDADGSLQLFCPTLMALKLKDEMMKYKKKYEIECDVVRENNSQYINQIETLESDAETLKASIQSLTQEKTDLLKAQDVMASLIKEQIGMDASEIDT